MARTTHRSRSGKKLYAVRDNRRTVITRRSRYLKIPVGCVEPFCFAQERLHDTHQENN
jgi:hypothetical protein